VKKTGAPKRLAWIAAILLTLYFVLHLLGMRDSVGFLSGTLPATKLELFLGLFTATSWFAAVLVAPVLLLAAGLQIALVTIAAKVRARRATVTLAADGPGVVEPDRLDAPIGCCTCADRSPGATERNWSK
jgi:hypothetical protein